MSTDIRSQIVSWADWCVANKPKFIYREARPFPLDITQIPIINDCSATFTLCYKLAGAPDPNGPRFNYDGYGNTDSLAANGTEIINGTQTHPGDAVIYYSGLTTVHVALITVPGPDPLTMSHGSNSEPAFIHVSQDGRSHRFFTFPLPTVAPTSPTSPTPTERKSHEMEVIATSSGSIKGDWYVKGSRRCNVSPTELSALQFLGISKITLTDDQLSQFVNTTWGQI